MMDMLKNALIIFARKPEMGKVKTRLANTLGVEKTLQIYIKLLEHTRAVARNLPCDTFIFLTEPTGDDFWEGFNCEIQQGKNLGDKMEHAFETLFTKGYQHCIIIGSDCPGIEPSLVENAFLSFVDNDVVIGPAEDGGYYLLGMKKLIKPVFRDKEWSTSNVFSETIAAIQNLHLAFKILPVLNDVDEEKDVPLKWLENLV